MATGDNDQKKADQMGASKPTAGSSLHTEKHDIPEYGKKTKNVAEPSAGTTTPAGKTSGDIKNDALGNPGRFTRNASTVAEPKNVDTAVVDEQLGTNIELTWRRFGKDQPDPKTDQNFKKNFNNPTD